MQMTHNETTRFGFCQVNFLDVFCFVLFFLLGLAFISLAFFLLHTKMVFVCLVGFLLKCERILLYSAQVLVKINWHYFKLSVTYRRT